MRNVIWVFPLAPTACAYAKLDEYFWEMRKAQIVALQMQGDFGDHLDVRKVTKSKSPRLQGNGKSKSVISEMGNTIEILLFGR